jgi:hypothetical protein
MNPEHDANLAIFGKGVALWTDMRQQLIDAGWSSEGAEQIVILAIQKSES